MAKRPRPDLSAIFQRTEPEPADPPRAEDLPETPAASSARPPSPTRETPAPAGRIVSVGVGLRESERAELDALAAELGVTRNAVMAYAVRWFLAEHRAGRAAVPIERAARIRS